MPDTDIAPATERFAAHVGPEARDRPEPALATAVGGAAAFLAALALAGLGGDLLVGGTSRGVVALLFLVYGLAGLALSFFGHPAQRTAGVVALATMVPGALGFWVLAVDGYSSSDVSTVLAGSTVAWGLLHVAGPARGHGLLLGGALVGAWATIVTAVGLDAFSLLDPFAEPQPAFGPVPDPVPPAVVSLAFGSAYLALGYVLDRAGLRGTATAFVGAGALATGFGVAWAAVDRTEVVGGLLLLVAGAAVGLLGTRLRRRTSTWLGAAAAVTGIATLAVAPFDEVRPAVVALVAAMAVVVAALPLLAAFLHESMHTNGYRG